MTRRALLVAMSVLLASCGGDTAAPGASRAPVAPVAPVTETIHGVRVVDNYRWLEEDTNDVASWTAGQNRHTRTVLDALAGRKQLSDRLKPLVRIGSVTAPVMRGNRYFFMRRTATQDQPVVYVRDGALGADRVLVDPNRLDETGGASVAWLSPTEDGKLLAYGTVQRDDELTTAKLLDVETAQPLALQIPNLLHEVQWRPDGSGFLYHSLRDATDRSSRQGAFHRMDTPSASDKVLYRQVAAKDNPRLAQSAGPSGTLSRDGRWILLAYWLNPSSNDLWLARFDEFLAKGAVASKAVSVGVAGQAVGTVIGDTLFLHTTKGAARGRVISANTARPAQPSWREIVPERPDAVIQSVAFGRATIAVTYVQNASAFIEAFDYNGRALGRINQPGIGTATITASDDRTEAYLSFTSFNYPPTVFRVDLANPSAPPKYWTSPDAPIDPSLAQVEQVSYPSKDGTKITMFLFHKKGFVPNGTAPTVLTGYGAFGVPMLPMFWGPFFRWVEAGGVIAMPNVRGGGEYGEAWHQAGMRDRKQTGIDDLIAAADWLVAGSYTTRERLAVHGTTSGGLLAAAAAMQRPDLFRAAILARPLTDMIRYQRFVNQPDWVAEYGSAEDADQFKALLAYSPYHRVKPATIYPAILITAAEGDPEVNSLHARKAAAALQAASSSNPAERPVLLRIDRPTENAAALLDLELVDVVDQLTFLNWQLGVR
jgi:prolyl oligopeptidase